MPLFVWTHTRLHFICCMKVINHIRPFDWLLDFLCSVVFHDSTLSYRKFKCLFSYLYSIIIFCSPFHLSIYNKNNTSSFKHKRQKRIEQNGTEQNCIVLMTWAIIKITISFWLYLPANEETKMTANQIKSIDILHLLKLQQSSLKILVKLHTILSLTHFPVVT